MVDIDLFRRIVSAGDLVDRLTINELKAENFPEPWMVQRLIEENRYLRQALEILQNQVSAFDENAYKACLAELKSVLQAQWDQLEIVHEEIPGKSEKAAVRSQLLNVDRVRWKNEINRLFGSEEELKDYATKGSRS